MATIRKLPSGKWNVQVRKHGHLPVSETFITKAAAERWARETEVKIENASFVDQSKAQNTTVKDLLGEYEEKMTPRKRSWRREKSRLKGLVARLGKYPLAGLTAQAVVDFVDARLSAGACSDTIRKDLNTLSHAIDTGIALWGIPLPFNPVITARKILSKTETLRSGVERDRRLRKGELKRLLEASDAVHEALWIWTVESGMRRGEIAAMEYAHRSGKTLRAPTSKTGRPRTIPMSPAMQRVWRKLPWERDDSGNPVRIALKPDSITRAFDRDCKAAEIGGLRFHDLRHEATSRFFERGLQIQEVASITGHSDWKSLKRYTHPSASEIAKKLNGARRGNRPHRERQPRDTSPPSAS